MAIPKILPALLAVLLITGCAGAGHKNTGKLCTTEFRMLTISVKDMDSDPVRLDDYYIQKVSTGEILRLNMGDNYQDSINLSHGIYVLLTDGQMWMTSPAGTEFLFTGKKDSLVIVSERYTIGNDECHVQLYSGNSNLILSE